MVTKSILQTITFKASPKEVYNLLMDEKKHSAFTGSKVRMSNRVNGKFNVFEGYCRGYNIELTEGEKIVQAWHFAEDGWPEDHFSICTFIFEKKDKKTRLVFSQTGIPGHKAAALKDGWKQYYWKPMKSWLENQYHQP
jgi:activator of HSP90 ATPase